MLTDHGPWELPRRKRKPPPALPDRSDLNGLTAWKFQSEPLPFGPDIPSQWSTDLVVVARIYEWMASGWGTSADLTGHRTEPMAPKGFPAAWS